MKYTPIRTDRFTIFSHEIQRDEKVGGMCRTVFQAWFHSEDVPKPVCIVTINESFMDYVEWVHVDEQYRRQGIATEVMHAIEIYIPGITLDGATDAGAAWCDHYKRLYPNCLFGISPADQRLLTASVHDFITHLESQLGNNAKYTNHQLINALFQSWEHRKNYVGVHVFECSRGCGVTTTLFEFARWINQPVLVISRHWEYWEKIGIDARSWLASIRGIQPRPELVLIDTPVSLSALRSAVTAARFEHWLKTFPYPAFYADQSKAMHT